ncbi:MAG: DUF2334 domain-containing protein [Candidatus Methanofastidiosia archaeon]
MSRNKCLSILAVIVVFGFFFHNLNLQMYFAPVSAFGNPIKTDYDYFTVNEYPYGHTGVCILTFDDVSGGTQIGDIERIAKILRKHNVRATYFVIPKHGGKSIENNNELVLFLKECQRHGDEISQHGYLHTPPDELKNKSKEQQEEIINSGREILEKLFGNIYGFRPPSFWRNNTTFKILAKEGYQYCASATIFNVFPYYPRDSVLPMFFGNEIDIIEIPCYPVDFLSKVARDNYSEQLFRLETRFNSCYDRRTPFVFFSHLETLNYFDASSEKYIGIEAFDAFLKHVKGRDVWTPTISEFATWHTLLRNAKIDYHFSSDRLIISIISNDVIDGITLNTNLPNNITKLSVYINNELCYKSDNFSVNHQIIL